MRQKMPDGLANMSVLVRADASSAIGTGHIFRAKAIFDPVRRAGGRIVFVCRESPGHLIGMLSEHDIDVRTIPDQNEPIADAEAMLRATSGERFDWLWVDHYELDARFEDAAKSAATRIAAMDDLANRPHNVDLLVDSSRPADNFNDYADLLPPDARLLIGPDYIPLRDEFLGVSSIDAGQRVERILVTLGGNDPLNTNNLVLDALQILALTDVAVDITVGTSNPRLDELTKRVSTMPGVNLHVQHPRLSELMSAAQLCIGAGGTTSWERCAMALPTLGLILAQNQVTLMEQLAATGAVKNLGWADQLDAAALSEAIAEAINDREWRLDCAARAVTLVDGGGVDRILEALRDWTNDKEMI